MKKMFLLLALVIPIITLFYFGLSRNPMLLPSALISKPAPVFRLQKMGGGEAALEEFQGKPVVLNFWSTWCGPCIMEHQVIRQAHQRYTAQGVEFISVLYEDTEENAKSFIKRYGQAAVVLLDPGLRTAIDYGVAGVPETFFIDREGRVVSKHAGPLTPDIVREAVENLLKGGLVP